MARPLLAAAAAAGLLAIGAMPLRAQTLLSPAPSPDGSPGVLTSFRFHLNAGALAIDDPRFSWEANIGGDVDLVDYGRGRLNFLANYETLLGDELQPFDPNQGNYTLDLVATARLGGAEIGGVFHHVSRHLGDRAKNFPIAWNMAGVQVLHRAVARRLEIQTSGRALYVTNRAHVDYRSKVDGYARLAYPVSPRVTLVASGAVTIIGVTRAIVDRGTQRGGRLELGVRLGGGAATLELFGGLERRIDADALERVPRTWALLGFRLTGRGAAVASANVP